MIRQKKSSATSRRGFTYIELIASVTIAGIVMVSIGAILPMAAQTLDPRNSVVNQRTTSGEIVGDLAEDLRHAISFTTRSANAVEFSVPDRTGDQLPDTVSYTWSGTPGDPLMYSFNGATPTSIADDVHQFDLEYISTYMIGLKPPPIAGSSVLFVVGNSGSLTTNESGRQSLLASWGYAVTLIDDGDTQANFDTAFVANDVVYVSRDVNAATLGNKVDLATIGVVTEEAGLAFSLGFTTASTTTVSNDSLSTLEDGHYITTDYPVSQEVIALTSNHTLAVIDLLDSGPGNFSLADTSDGATDYPSIITLDPGDPIDGGGEVAGRRVHLPWGTAATSAFTGDGLYLLKRAIEWGAGAGENSPLKEMLMVVVDPASLTNQEQQRKAMLEDWGYKVALIASDDSQSAFDLAITEADVVYVPCHITEVDLGLKLRHSAIGVVNASNELHEEFGLYSNHGAVQNDKKEIDIIEKRHYITQPLPSGVFQVFTGSDEMSKFSGNLGDALVLANVIGSNNGALATLDTGQPMEGPDHDPAPARRVYLPWGGLSTFELVKLHNNGRQVLQRSLEWAAGAEAVIPEALCVVANAAGPGGAEDDRIAKLESFGYSVTLISEDDTQANFDAAIAATDVIFVCETVDAAQLGSKITNAPVGIVNEHLDLVTELGFSSDAVLVDNGNQIELTDNSHYITEEFSLGTLPLLASTEKLKYLSGIKADGVQSLGLDTTNASRKGLAVIAGGQLLYGGGTAAGRRISLPWGDGINYDDLTPDAVTLLQRSLEWGRGAGDDGVPDAAAVNLGYEPMYASEETLIENRSVAMQVTLTETAIFTSISGYFYDKDKSLRYAIYTDASGEPGNLLVESEKISPDGNGPQWTSIDLPTLTLPAGTYWLAFGIDNNNEKYFYEADGTQQVRYKNFDPIGGGFLSSWGSSDASYTRKISIYGTYTPQ